MIDPRIRTEFERICAAVGQPTWTLDSKEHCIYGAMAEAHTRSGTVVLSESRIRSLPDYWHMKGDTASWIEILVHEVTHFRVPRERVGRRKMWHGPAFRRGIAEVAATVYGVTVDPFEPRTIQDLDVAIAAAIGS